MASSAPLLTALEPAVLGASLRSMTELITCCGLGAIATRAGLIDRDTTRALARCVFNIFLPAMLFTSVASTVASGAGWWTLAPVTLAAALQVGLGLLLSSLLLKLLRVPRHSPAARDVTTLSAFGNSGVLPLIFVDCLFRADPTQLARANALVAMFLLGWSPLFWTLGFSLLAGTPEPGSDQASRPAAVSANVLDTLRRRTLTPPICACLAGMVVGGVPALRSLLVPGAGGALVLPLHRCLSIFAKAYSPAALLVLASSLATPIRPLGGKGGTARSDSGDGTIAHPPATLRIRDTAVVSAVRFLLLPLSFALALAGLRCGGILAADPLRDFVLIMQSTMPSAQNAVLALQVNGEPERASRMARLLLVIYLIALLPIATTLTHALQHSRLSVT